MRSAGGGADGCDAERIVLQPTTVENMIGGEGGDFPAGRHPHLRCILKACRLMPP